MDPYTIIGLAAAALTTLSFLPQAIKVIKTKHVKDLSLGMYIVFIVGVTLWLIYGILLSNLPMILANIVTLIITLVILYMIIKYK